MGQNQIKSFFLIFKPGTLNSFSKGSSMQRSPLKQVLHKHNME